MINQTNLIILAGVNIAEFEHEIFCIFVINAFFSDIC